MLSKITLFWIVLLYMQTLGLGFPEGDLAATTTTTASPPKNDSAIVFLDTPKDTETILGSSVLLPCRTEQPVIDCQWSWRPLPPVHLPLPDTNSTDVIDVNATAITPPPSPPVTPSLPVRLFPSFGNNSNDCSVRFTNTQHEQIGYWTCAARKTYGDSFVSTEPARLSILAEKNETSISFIKTDDAQEALVGSSGQIICRTETPVKDCQWSWRLFNQTEQRNLEVKKFPAFGPDNQDCSIKFKNVLSEQEGLWTCGARSESNGTFIQAKPIRFFVSEVEFVQLSRGIQIAAGESALLRCLVNKPVVQCEWSWKPINSTKEQMVIKKFTPNSDNEHDCSVRFKNVLYEEEGLWTCGVRLTDKGHLHEAPPAKLTLLPSAKLSFVDTPQNNTLFVNTQEILKCTTNSKIDKCLWLWRPLTGDTEPTVIREFPPMEPSSKNCSLNFPQVRIEDQGYWACRVSIATTNTHLTTPSAKVVVYEQDKIEFSELSKDIQISSGGSVLLRCVTTLSVEQCTWSLTPVNSNTTVVVKQFPAVGAEGRDCSVRLSHALAEQEGLWTCGAKVHGKENYTYAPPAKLSLLEPEPVAVAVWTSPHQKVTLACKLDPVPVGARCQWIHKEESDKRNETFKKRQDVLMNYTTGLCTLQLKPEASDLGSWICRFNINTSGRSIELGNATLILLKPEPVDQVISWIVGAVTTIILFLMILAVVLVVWRGKFFFRKKSKILETAVHKKRSTSTRKRSRSNSEPGPKLTTHVANEAVVPTNSNNFYDTLRQYHPPTSRIYESFATS